MKAALQISSNFLKHYKEAEDKLIETITKLNLYLENKTKTEKNKGYFLNILYLKQCKNLYEFY
jgi:hypothetical protein